MKNVSLPLVLAISVFALPAAAHHNFSAHYRGDETITITGVVKEFRFINPHARIYIEVTGADGTIQEWMAEGDASVALRRSGWTPDQLQPGDRIEIVGNPSRNGSNMVSWNSIALMDGTLFGGGDGRLDERLRILDRRLAEFRAHRGR